MPGRLQDFDVETFVLEEAFVPRHQKRQVVDGIHHRDGDFLELLLDGHFTLPEIVFEIAALFRARTAIV